MGRRESDVIARDRQLRTWPRSSVVRGVLLAFALMALVAGAAVLPVWLG